ncbi:MAG: hypothetical protein KGZ65_04160 [Sphingomonadales bacterium]|nr:hypothetical protein [Sphingomonadaceae bacterium]MBS3930407.1 hypothetical protein [Sphingomonadales bacterium]
MSENLDPFCPHCKQAIVPRYIRIHHIPMCADLAAARAALMKIDDRVNNEGDDSQACVSDIGHIARAVLAKHTGGKP